MLSVEQTSHQINFFAENISDVSSLWRRLLITCQATKKINVHRCSFLNITAEHQIFFFVIPKVCLMVCVFYFQNALHLPLETSDTAV